jgi:hypothetical protein
MIAGVTSLLVVLANSTKGWRQAKAGGRGESLACPCRLMRR